jgi:DDE_Tnp_1-associated
MTYFCSLEDPRSDHTRRHQLIDIITIAVCGVICGADSWVDMELFGRSKEGWLRGFLELPNGIPSHDTFGRVSPTGMPSNSGAVSWNGSRRSAQ